MRERVPTPAEQLRDMPEECPWLDPGEQGENLQIHDFPTFLLLRLANVTKHHLTRRYLDPYGISLPEWRLLALLARFGSMLFSEVTDGSSMDKGQVSRTLKAIHRKGLVKLNTLTTPDRARSSAISARMEVSISPKGRALFNRILPIARAQQTRLIEFMTPEERRVFHALSLRLIKAVANLPEVPVDADAEALGS